MASLLYLFLATLALATGQSDDFSQYRVYFDACNYDEEKGVTWHDVEMCEAKFAKVMTANNIPTSTKERFMTSDLNGDGVLSYSEWIKGALDDLKKFEEIKGAPSGDKCCSEKMVGGVEYRYVRDGMTGAYGCLADCIYERVDTPGSMFCFAAGDLEVVCEDAPYTGDPSNTTDSQGK